MKTAGREKPNHGVALPRNRAQGAEEQNRSRSIKWAEKQEKFQPKEMCFLLTSTFIDREDFQSTRKSYKTYFLWVVLWVEIFMAEAPIYPSLPRNLPLGQSFQA